MIGFLKCGSVLKLPCSRWPTTSSQSARQHEAMLSTALPNPVDTALFIVPLQKGLPKSSKCILYFPAPSFRGLQIDFPSLLRLVEPCISASVRIFHTSIHGLLGVDTFFQNCQQPLKLDQVFTITVSPLVNISPFCVLASSSGGDGCWVPPTANGILASEFQGGRNPGGGRGGLIPYSL